MLFVGRTLKTFLNSRSYLTVNIGSYRDGCDGISWHADDTQGEETVLSLVVESKGDPRTLCIQPSDTSLEQAGDEQIELYPDAGDAYAMDGKFEH
jgi:alkylated DNA repair dioxygenase AlkB